MVYAMINEIDSIISRINTHPEYLACVNKERSRALREEAEKHSLDIEILSEEKKLSRKERHAFLERLDNVFSFLSKEGISLYGLSKLGFLVEPKKNPNENFRNVFIDFGSFKAPDPQEIHIK